MRFTFFSDPLVKTAVDLKGGIVGVSSFGSESDIAATLALQKLGLTRADVTLKEVGGSPQRLAAIKSGAIKAAAMNEPVATQAREQGLFPMLDLFAEQIPWLFTGLSVTKRYLDGNRDLLYSLHKSDSRRQLPGACRREVGQRGACQGVQTLGSQDHRYRLH